MSNKELLEKLENYQATRTINHIFNEAADEIRRLNAEIERLMDAAREAAWVAAREAREAERKAACAAYAERKAAWEAALAAQGEK